MSLIDDAKWPTRVDVLLTLLCQVDSSAATLWTGLFPVKGVSCYYSLLEYHDFDEKSVYPVQTPFFAASDLGLYCLLMSPLWDARDKWIKQQEQKKTYDSCLPWMCITSP